MPLLDHFRPPLRTNRHWEGFHSAWANQLVTLLNGELLPEAYFAEPHVHMGPRIEVDVATLNGAAEHDAPANGELGAVATLSAPAWAPPATTFTMPAVFPDTFEVRVINTEAGPRLAAAIELVSPGNKDREESRVAFATKCASYLAQGVSVIVVDVVTGRVGNLHDELVRLVPGWDSFVFPGSPPLYAGAYRPLHRAEGDEIDVWLTALAIGRELPTMPLGLDRDLMLPIDLERTYSETCRTLRIAPQG